MKQWTLSVGVCAALLLSCWAVALPASELRETALVRAIQRVRTSVVSIHSEKTASDKDAVFSTGKSRKINGMGTGVILDERGYILTNYHVVAEVDSLRVTLDNAGSFDARVVSSDREHDLAVIKIDASGPLAVMPVGTSSDLMLGETVFAIGNAFGYEQTVTEGIVSALSRDVEVNETQSYKNLIQTDASINPGNSGGPLVNLDGEVIGINVAIRAGAQRIGFAIPIDDARRIAAKLMSVEELNHTWHGIIGRDIKKGGQRMLIVDRAEPESPAARAGLQPGDVVLRAGSTPVVDAVDLERAFLGRPIGETLEITVRRKDKTETLPVAVAMQPFTRNIAATAEPVVRANNDTAEAEKAWQMLGVRLIPLPNAQKHLVSPRYRGGMRITEVRPDGPAAANGIRVGDVLVGLHLWETLTHDNIAWILNQPQAQGQNSLKFYILRGQETLYGHLQVASRQQAAR